MTGSMNMAYFNQDKNQALVLEIQRMSTEDGPGIRSTVFFKGCPLRCSWCHNPESISRFVQAQWMATKCIGCMTCIDVCPHGALKATDNTIVIDRDLCQGCGQCAEQCPSTAMEMLGKAWTVEDLEKEVLKDRAYFEKSGGGITLSGGEPTLWPDFCAKFLKHLKEKGIHTAVDTCGQYSHKAIDALLPYTDLLLHDIKEIDPVKHKAFTGITNKTILDNLGYIARYLQSHEHAPVLWIRTPLIPDATARIDNIARIGRFIQTHLNDLVARWDLCTFNNLCQDKYERLGQNWNFAKSELLNQTLVRDLVQAAENSGVDPKIVHQSGMTRQQDHI